MFACFIAIAPGLAFVQEGFAKTATTEILLAASVVHAASAFVIRTQSTLPALANFARKILLKESGFYRALFQQFGI